LGIPVKEERYGTLPPLTSTPRQFYMGAGFADGIILAGGFIV
jgi:hypothetical protein